MTLQVIRLVTMPQRDGQTDGKVITISCSACWRATKTHPSESVLHQEIHCFMAATG